MRRRISSAATHCGVRLTGRGAVDCVPSEDGLEMQG